eukprot:ctg_2745.g462
MRARASACMWISRVCSIRDSRSACRGGAVSTHPEHGGRHGAGGLRGHVRPGDAGDAGGVAFASGYVAECAGDVFARSAGGLDGGAVREQVAARRHDA